MKKMMKVDIIVPAHSEGEYLEKNIDEIIKALNHNMVNFKWKVIIGENGSNDNTFNVAKNLERKYANVKAIHFDKASKDSTIKKLWLDSKADIMIFTDADNSAEPRHISELINAIKEGNDIAVGSRVMEVAKAKRNMYRVILSKIYNNILLPLILPTDVKDTQCGFKAINRKVVQTIVPKLGEENGFFDTEMLAVARYKGHKIKEIPVVWKETRKSVLSVNKNIPNFIKNIFKTKLKIMQGYYD